MRRDFFTISHSCLGEDRCHGERHTENEVELKRCCLFVEGCPIYKTVFVLACNASTNTLSFEWIHTYIHLIYREVDKSKLVPLQRTAVIFRMEFINSSIELEFGAPASSLPDFFFYIKHWGVKIRKQPPGSHRRILGLWWGSKAAAW